MLFTIPLGFLSAMKDLITSETSPKKTPLHRIFWLKVIDFTTY